MGGPSNAVVQVQRGGRDLEGKLMVELSTVSTGDRAVEEKKNSLAG